MATVTSIPPEPPLPPELHNGDRMTREEFHRIYELMPKSFRAELIGGVVYVGSPLRRRHGTNHIGLGMVIGIYRGNTPGVEAGDNATVILSDEDEPQPDLYLRILPEYGGQSRSTEDDYVAGAPELLSEIAHSSRSVDLHAKREQYRRYGVLEYIVVCLHERRVRWFDLRTDQEYVPDAEGVYRSQVFPGLWIHGAALLDWNYQQLMSTLEKGLASAEHMAFVNRLAATQRPG